jgi:hypothetical protein
MAQTDDLVRELKDAVERARALERRGSAGDLARRPAPGKWSAAECVEHLNLATRAYLPKLQAAFAELRDKGLRSPGPYGMEIGARLLLWAMEPPVRFRFPTTAPFRPGIAIKAENVIGEFALLQERLVDLIEKARGLALDRARVVSPFSARMKYNAYAACVLIASHQRRHLWQAERALG